MRFSQYPWGDQERDSEFWSVELDLRDLERTSLTLWVWATFLFPGMCGICCSIWVLGEVGDVAFYVECCSVAWSGGNCLLLRRSSHPSVLLSVGAAGFLFQKDMAQKHMANPGAVLYLLDGATDADLPFLDLGKVTKDA